MKNGPVYSDEKYRWHERQWPLLGGNYFTHAWGTLYVLSGRIAQQISSIPDGSLRFFSNEGVEAALSFQGWRKHCCFLVFESNLSSRPKLATTSRGVHADLVRAHADVTIGSWLLALNSTHFDDRRLCETSCTGTSIGVYDFPKCAGLCNPVTRLRELQSDPACQIVSEGELSILKGFFDFPHD